MNEKDDLTQDANKAALAVIVDSGETDLVWSMAAWLTLECHTRKGESQSAAQTRIEAEAKRRWPESTSDDLDRAQALSAEALEMSNAIFERRVDGHKLH